MASYHRVREVIAAGYLQFNWEYGKSNPADILSECWGFASIWPLLKPQLFWQGDTGELTAKTKGSDRILPKRGVISLTLNDQGWVHNPNITPRGYPIKFWCLFGMVAPIAHTTQQTFLFCPSAKSDTFQWLRQILQYLNQSPLSPNNNSNTYTSYTYILIKHLTFL